MPKNNVWPKKIPELSAEQVEIKKDFMKYWHEVLPQKYGLLEKFNHGFSARNARHGQKVLEIGAGLGEHIAYEPLMGVEYYAMEILPKMAEAIKQRYPIVKVVTGDCEKPTNFDNNFFDRIIAVHVLEHLNNLPATIREMRRILKNGGEFNVIIPCEGGWLYSLARFVSAERLFKKRYNMDYGWLIRSEHVNKPNEIIEEITREFEIKKIRFFPFYLPVINFNLVIGLILTPKK
jgi:SAM-dependent methyltransferase